MQSLPYYCTANWNRFTYNDLHAISTVLLQCELKLLHLQRPPCNLYRICCSANWNRFTCNDLHAISNVLLHCKLESLHLQRPPCNLYRIAALQTGIASLTTTFVQSLPYYCTANWNRFTYNDLHAISTVLLQCELESLHLQRPPCNLYRIALEEPLDCEKEWRKRSPQHRRHWIKVSIGATIVNG